MEVEFDNCLLIMRAYAIEITAVLAKLSTEESANEPVRGPLLLEQSALRRRKTKDRGHSGTTEESWNSKSKVRLLKCGVDASYRSHSDGH